MKWLYLGWIFLIARIENVFKCLRGWIGILFPTLSSIESFKVRFLQHKPNPPPPPLVGSITVEGILEILNFRGVVRYLNINMIHSNYRLSLLKDNYQILLKICVQLKALYTGKLVRRNNFTITITILRCEKICPSFEIMVPSAKEL